MEQNYCCLCVELRHGSLILGYLNLIGYSILTLLSVLSLAAYTAYEAERHANGSATIGSTMHIIMIFFMLKMFIHLIFIIVLLIGLHQKKRKHIRAYIVLAILWIIFNLILFIYALAKGSPFKSLIQLLVRTVLLVYTVWVVNSYLKKLNDPDKEPAFHNTA